MLTFGDALDDPGIIRVISYAPRSEDAKQLINSSIRRFMRRGDFSGSLVPIYVCMRGGCVVWPRYVQTVRALAPCNGNVKPENMWGSFLPRDMGAPWRQGLRWSTHRDCSAAMIQQGRSSVYQDIQGDGRLVRVYSRCNQDQQKFVTLFGIDNNDQPLQHLDISTNTWLPGLPIEILQPFGSTSVYVRRIDYVLVDEIECPINLYGYYAAGDVLEDIAQYDPGDTRPSFERTKIKMGGFDGGLGVGGGCSAQSCCRTGINALVKLRWFQCRYDTDLIIIDNLDALKLMIQAQKFGEAGDRQNSKAFEADAIAELNLQLRDESPDDQFQATNQVFGDRSFQNKCF